MSPSVNLLYYLEARLASPADICSFRFGLMYNRAFLLFTLRLYLIFLYFVPPNVAAARVPVIPASP